MTAEKLSTECMAGKCLYTSAKQLTLYFDIAFDNTLSHVLNGPSVVLGVDTMWLCQLSLFVVQLTTLCLPKGLPKNDSF